MNQNSSFSVYNASAGSGKTFSLVKEYLKKVLETTNRYQFQKILAITFTNKAAAEMKDRVLENLKLFSEGNENEMFSMLSEELALDKKKLQERSQTALEAILQNYSAFNITTIDSFTHKIIRTFAYDLGLPLNFEVEMDGVRLLSEAVDVLISKIGENKELTEVLIEYAVGKINEDKSWDIAFDLNASAKLLLSEDHVSQLQRLDGKSLKDFRTLEKKLKKKQQEITSQFITFGEKGLEIIERSGVDHKDFYQKDLPRLFNNLKTFSKIEIGKLDFKGRLAKNMDAGVFYSASKSETVKQSIDAISDTLQILYFEVKAYYKLEYPSYVLSQFVLKNLIPLAVLKNIQDELQAIKEQNNICLNSEFNQLISKKIKDEPAPFIYERIGEKFQNYFIDEMQDTSGLQWQNLIPLINNALSQEKGSLLLVGDAKQAIYRWRGGKSEQFMELYKQEKSVDYNPFLVEKNIQNLDTNYRSFSEIVQFNNLFFTHTSQFLENPEYKELYLLGNQQKENRRKGGYVQLNFLKKNELDIDEKKNAFANQVLETVQSLPANRPKSDVCVLVRSKREGLLISEVLTQNGISIISSETLLVQNDPKVQFVVQLLSYIQNPLDTNAKFLALSFLYKHLKTNLEEHVFYQTFLAHKGEDFYTHLQTIGVHFNYRSFLQMPFYESMEALMRSFRLFEESNAFVTCFLDFVLEFQRSKVANIAAFLEYWELKKESLSIAAVENKEAVRIMTIHKSKGLEFPIVIFPCELNVFKEQNPTTWYDALEENLFKEFETFLVSCSEKLSLTGDFGASVYKTRKQEVALDNANLLYVALTRAVEELYIITEYKTDKKGEENTDWFSGMFINYLKSLSDENVWSDSRLEYTFGEKRIFEENQKNEQPTHIEKNMGIISSSWEAHGINIVSNSSKNWGTKQEEAIEYGLLVHEMLSKINYAEEATLTVKNYILQGLVKKEDGESILNQLKKVLSHPELKRYFQKGKKIVCERALLTKEGEKMIPDRLVFQGREVAILDYKTGKYEKSHRAQVTMYGDLLQKMGYQVTRKLVIYLGKQIKIDSF
jgi:ATP-dependent exoDNAse (exonuclease V) beta subunit